MLFVPRREVSGPPVRGICTDRLEESLRLETPSLKSLSEDLYSGFLRPEKSIDLTGFEPANLGSRGENVTPRPLKSDRTVQSRKFR